MTSRLLVLAPVLALTACSAETYRRSADRQVYGIVEEKQKEALGRAEPFTLDEELIPLELVGRPGFVEDFRRAPAPSPIFEATILLGESDEAEVLPDDVAGPIIVETLPEDTHGPPALGPGDPEEDSAVRVSLDEAVSTGAPVVPVYILDLEATAKLAFANNRDYQSQKESLYLSALSLTLARWQFAPRFFGFVGGDLERDGFGEESGSVSSDFGWNQLFASGARVSVSIFNNLFQFFTGDRRESASSVISATLTQPLLRGFGSAIVTEPLTQAERNVIYQARALERFRQTFIVEVASEFYRVLQDRNRVTNEYLNWQSLVNNLDRSRDRAEAELLPKFEVQQVEQQELAARNRYVVAVEDYETSLDRFKVTLNIPIEADVAFDQAELSRLAEQVDDPIDVDPETAIVVALQKRVDLRTAWDRSEDAERQVGVAADALRAQLDLQLRADVPSGELTGGAETPFKFDTKDGTYGVGLDLDLPFDRRSERNNYVSTQIAAERERREASLFEDSVRLTVRDAYRRLRRERESLTIQSASVDLAEERVASTQALRDAGRSETRDLLESQDALIEARNAYTEALINFRIARLEFHRDTGTLRVSPRGEFREEFAADLMEEDS